MIRNDIREQIEQRGYCLIPELLGKEEVYRLRGQCEEFFESHEHMRSHLGRSMPDVVSYLPEIHWLYAHPRVIAAFRAALGTDDIVFTRHCDIAKNRLNSWHKDSNGYFNGNFYADPACRVYKMAVYLQDHVNAKTGFILRDSSHHTPDLDTGDVKYMQTRRGDVVIFDVRLTHSGQFATLPEKILMKVSGLTARGGKHNPEWAVRAKDAYWRLRGIEDRYTVFFTYGLPNVHTRSFSERNMARQREQLAHVRTDSSLVPSGLDALAEQLGGLGVKIYGYTFGPETSNNRAGDDQLLRAST